MADNEQIQIVTAEEYIQSISPNANVSESTVKGILIDAAIDAGHLLPN